MPRLSVTLIISKCLRKEDVEATGMDLLQEYTRRQRPGDFIPAETIHTLTMAVWSGQDRQCNVRICSQAQSAWENFRPPTRITASTATLTRTATD